MHFTGLHAFLLSAFDSAASKARFFGKLEQFLANFSLQRQ